MKIIFLLFLFTFNAQADFLTQEESFQIKKVANELKDEIEVSLQNDEQDCELLFDESKKTNDTILTPVSFIGCGGGNYYRTYLILTKKVSAKWIVEDIELIGASRIFSYSNMKLTGRYVTLSGKKWGGEDPNCCPTVPANFVYKIDSNRIIPE